MKIFSFELHGVNLVQKLAQCKSLLQVVDYEVQVEQLHLVGLQQVVNQSFREIGEDSISESFVLATYLLLKPFYVRKTVVLLAQLQLAQVLFAIFLLYFMLS